MKTVQGVREWMEAFAKAVRSQDYDAGQGLFSNDVIGFGTYSPRLLGLDSLVENQWKPIWSVTRNFRFHGDTMRCDVQGEFAWAAAVWESEGRLSDDTWHLRTGRATLILRWHQDGWRAIHSHFSLQPQCSESKSGVSE